MNYFRIYDNIINRAKTRTMLGYSENHHIVPKCMGGTDCKTNLVRLTPEEHYLAHQLLVKMYPENRKLVYAALIMCQSKEGVIRNNKLYGWIRKAVSKSRKNIPKSGEHKQKLRDANLGKKLSEETREKMRNKIVSQEARDNISKAILGKKKPERTQEHKDNLGKALKKPKSKEGRENIGLGAIKRSIKTIMEKKNLYISFYKMYDEKYTKHEIKEYLCVKERAYYGYISNRSYIENTIKEHQDAQSLKG